MTDRALLKKYEAERADLTGKRTTLDERAMTPEDLDRLLSERGARIAAEQARQADALKAAKSGPWSPALVVVKPRRRKAATSKVTPMRRHAHGGAR